MLIINLNRQHVYTFVQSSDIAKNWHFGTLIIVNTCISVAAPLDPKTEIHHKTFLTPVVTKISLLNHFHFRRIDRAIFAVLNLALYVCFQDAPKETYSDYSSPLSNKTYIC